MSELQNLKFEKTDGVARITLNRPKVNMMNIEMMAEINSLLESFVSDQDLKCVVIDAEGKHFCTGVEVGDHKPDKVDDMIATFNRIFELLEQIDVPIIAVVQGFCLGGGMELAIACDVIVAGIRGLPSVNPKLKSAFSRHTLPSACHSWWDRPRQLKSAQPVNFTRRRKHRAWVWCHTWRKTANSLKLLKTSSKKFRPTARSSSG